MTPAEELVLIENAIDKFYRSGGLVEWQGPDGIGRRVDIAFLQRRRSEIQTVVAVAAARAAGDEFLPVRFEAPDA